MSVAALGAPWPPRAAERTTVIHVETDPMGPSQDAQAGWDVPAPASACYVVAGWAAGPIFPIGLDWVAATFTGYRPATSWALTGAFVGGIVGPAAAAGGVSVAGLHTIPRC